MLFDSSIRITIGKGVTWKGRRIYESGGVRPHDRRPVSCLNIESRAKEMLVR